MSDLNQCNFIGRLGKDPETKYMPNGNAVTNFSIAVGEQWKDKAGVKQEKTEWINVTGFGKLAEIMGEWLVKGSQVLISGKFTTDKWQDQEGKDRYSTKIIANTMQMLGSREEAKPKPMPADYIPTSSNPTDYANKDELESDIPF